MYSIAINRYTSQCEFKLATIPFFMQKKWEISPSWERNISNVILQWGISSSETNGSTLIPRI